MTDTGLIRPGDTGEEGEAIRPAAEEADSPVVEAGKNGARRRGKALRDFLQAASTGAVAGGARYAAERVLKELFDE